jgi:hypothetical protein
VTRLVHPETGGEFNAPESAVPIWQRSGWVTADQAQAQAGQAAGKSAAGNTATNTSQEK